jgi:hypothetical protein
MEIIMKTENTKNQPKGMKVKSSVKAGGDQVSECGHCHNHNQTVARESKSLRVKSGIKAGCDQSGTPGLLGCWHNHNQTIRKG